MNYEKVSIMNQKALKTLEYDKIIEQLASYASSPLGRKKCLELVPSSSLSQITRMQHETHDALTRLFKKGHISFGDAKDIRGALKRLEIGSSMNITELLQTAALLENTARVKAYGRRENADQTPDSLEDLFETLEPLTLLSTKSAAVFSPRMKSAMMQARIYAASVVPSNRVRKKSTAS